MIRSLKDSLARHNPSVPASDWDKPIWFPASTERPDKSWGEAAQSTCPLIGWVPSLYIGTQAGWRVDGIHYPSSAFEETLFAGSFTGGSPVGLTPVKPLILIPS